MPEPSFREAAITTAAPAPTPVDTVPGKTTRAADLAKVEAASESAISRVKARAGETFSGGGYSYLVQADGTFKVTAGPSSIGVVFEPNGNHAQAWLNCAKALAKIPRKVAKPDGAATGATPAGEHSTGEPSNPKPPPADSDGFHLPSLAPVLDSIGESLSRASQFVSGMFDFSDSPAAANAVAPAVDAGAAAANPGDPQLAQQCTMDGNLNAAKAMADRLTIPHSYDATDTRAAEKAAMSDGTRKTALIAGEDGKLKTIVCSEFTTLSLAKSGIDMSQPYRDPKTGKKVGWKSGGSVAFADLYGVTGNQWETTTGILAAQRGDYKEVESGSELAKSLNSHETETFLLVTPKAVGEAVDLHDGDAFGAGAVAQSLGGKNIEMKDRRPGDLQQRLATIDGKSKTIVNGKEVVGAGHSSQVWAVRGQGVVYLGAANSPTLHTTKAADIPPGWYALDGVAMEIDPMTDPATVASVDVTYVQLIDANTKGSYKADSEAKTGKSPRGGDATSVGAMTEATAYTDKGASDLISAGRLPSSKWSEWKPTAPPVIGTITPDGINH